jgi:hypothetical protein
MPRAHNAVRTTYRDTAFRTPLDARWAVFFDHLDMAWTYQARGFVLDGQEIRPHFWLPEYECFWDVRVTHRFDRDLYGTWAAVANTPIIISTRMPHHCSSLSETRAIVFGFPCAAPVPWPGPDPALPNLKLRQPIAETTGRTWVYSENRLPGPCPGCARPVLLWFDEATGSVRCPRCWCFGVAGSLVGRLCSAGDAAAAWSF